MDSKNMNYECECIYQGKDTVEENTGLQLGAAKSKFTEDIEPKPQLSTQK